MKLIYSGKAKSDLMRLREWIQVHNPTAAARVAQRIRQAADRLKAYPVIGVALEDLPGCREWVVDSYIIRYRVIDDTVQILRIWHGREDHS